MGLFSIPTAESSYEDSSVHRTMGITQKFVSQADVLDVLEESR